MGITDEMVVGPFVFLLCMIIFFTLVLDLPKLPGVPDGNAAGARGQNQEGDNIEMGSVGNNVQANDDGADTSVMPDPELPGYATDDPGLPTYREAVVDIMPPTVGSPVSPMISVRY